MKGLIILFLRHLRVLNKNHIYSYKAREIKEFSQNSTIFYDSEEKEVHTSKYKSSLIKTKCRNTLLIFFLNPVGNIPKNGGQIIKQLLADENYDLSRFTCVKQAEVIRRKKLRLVYTDFIHHPHDTLSFWYLPLKC